MRFIILLFLAVFLQSCVKPKAVLICGDHICVNKEEANQYFEKNLTIEVKIIDKKRKDYIDLVELNMKNKSGNKKVRITKKDKTNKNIKVLSNDEILKIKKKIKKDKKLAKKKDINLKKLQSKIEEKNKRKFESKNKIDKRKRKIYDNEIVDICTIVKKCSIDEISKYLIKIGKDKKFPDITLRE